MKLNTFANGFQKVNKAYDKVCEPLVDEIGIPKTAFDILMFFGNHPEYNTAKDIVKVRGLKANLVSINVDRLVNEGYLERIYDTKDRRKIFLSITDKSTEIIEKGKILQQNFFNSILQNISEEDLETTKRVFMKMEQNIEKM